MDEDEFYLTGGIGHKAGKVRKKYVDYLDRLFSMYKKGHITERELIIKIAEWIEEQVK